MNELNAFVSMIYKSVEKSFTVKLDGLIMATLNNMTAQTLFSDFGEITGDLYKDKSSIKAVNLLYEYNTKFTKTLTVANALTDADFLKYASVVINSYVDRISTAKRGLWNFENFMFKFASRPDYYNRMTIFTA